jgi:hypothetical protein
MDPLSLVAMASTTFKGIQIMVNKGAEIEAVAQKLSAWYAFAADIKQAEQESENPPIFKKLFDGQTVEQQALNSVIARKKLEEQEKQIRELIVWAYGVETYQEMIMMRRSIKAKRDKAIYRQRRRRRIMLDSTFGIIGLLVAGAVIFGTVAFIQGAS